jgi:LmbE family N-acetylglucosaminyl deacetylase
MGALHPAEYPLVEDLSRELADLLPSAYTLVVPLALGGHVDHRLVRAAAERLVASGASAWFYADYPYVLGYTTELDLLRQAGWIPCSNPVSPEGITAWQDAIAAHTSQISTFWPDLAAMQEAIQAYCDAYQGVQLWKNGE